MMVIGLGSIRVGLGSMLPNVLPLLCLGGYLGVAYDRIDSDTLVIAIMALGIGVDDTIHFLMRYRIESRRTEDTRVAVERTYAFSGRAIILTTMVLVLGFLPFSSSDYFSAFMIGTFLPGVLVMALLADLLLVPALVQVGWLRFKKKKHAPDDVA
jgi:predicted RND superfamily exporter protein